MCSKELLSAPSSPLKSSLEIGASAVLYSKPTSTYTNTVFCAYASVCVLCVVADASCVCVCVRAHERVVCVCGGGGGQCYSTLRLSAPPRGDPWAVVHSVQLAKADAS